MTHPPTDPRTHITYASGHEWRVNKVHLERVFAARSVAVGERK